MSTFTKQAAQAARNARYTAKRMAHRASLVKHPAVKATFESFPLRLRRRVSLRVSDYSDSVHISLTLRDLNSFKDKTLLSVLEPFATAVWESETSDYTYGTPNRDYKFKMRHHEGFNIEVFVWAYVKEDSPLCRIVVTGIKEEVVRTEVKEIVCA